MKRISKFINDNLAFLTVLLVCLLCATFICVGTVSDGGFITINGKDADIKPYTEEFIEDANAALNRIMNEDQPSESAEGVSSDGQGFYTTISDILARRLPDGNDDNGKGWQCSKYTAYLATGKREYSTAHPDYGPVHGKNMAAYLVNNFGFKYIDQPVEGAIGSGGFNTTYGHTAMYLYSTGTNTAMVNDANYTPLKVSTHNMNIAGWVWVVPSSYNPSPTPTPEPTPQPTPVSKDEYVVKKGDTLGQIVKDMHWCDGCKLFGDDGYTQKLAEYNNIPNRGLIYPNQLIKRLQWQLSGVM